MPAVVCTAGGWRSRDWAALPSAPSQAGVGGGSGAFLVETGPGPVCAGAGGVEQPSALTGLPAVPALALLEAAGLGWEERGAWFLRMRLPAAVDFSTQEPFGISCSCQG